MSETKLINEWTLDDFDHARVWLVEVMFLMDQLSKIIGEWRDPEAKRLVLRMNAIMVEMFGDHFVEWIPNKKIIDEMKEMGKSMPMSLNCCNYTCIQDYILNIED